jgi:hypothetical protein
MLVLAIAGANARQLFGATWDDTRYHTEIAPARLAAAEAVQGGALPAWWDGSGLGVPLAGEPSHGAMYPPAWITASPRALDWLAIAHLIWAAIGVAIWARQRSQKPPRLRTWSGDASEPAAVVVALLVATSGLFASMAVRGALPAIAHLPWIGAAACWLGEAESKSTRARAAAVLGALIGLVGLSGSFAGLLDALILVVALAARRSRAGAVQAALEEKRAQPYAIYVIAAVLGGLAISAAQWLPAVFQLTTPHAGLDVSGMPLARLLELVVPLASGSPDPDRAIAALAGEQPWAPSVFVGAPLLALAAVKIPSRRVLAMIIALVALTLIAGRGGWPGWAGAFEVHLAALVVVLGAHAGAGLDGLLAGERRALFSLAAGVFFATVALIAIAVLRSSHPSDALDRALFDGGLGIVCSAIALALVWRGPKRSLPVVLALLVVPSFGAQPAIAPTIERAIVSSPPAWAEAAARMPVPRRVYRPERMVEVLSARAPVTTPTSKPAAEPAERESLDDAIATFAGTSGWRWGIAAARSEDPARLAIHDQTWSAASSGGGKLLDRFGISLAILPEAVVFPRHMTALGLRGRWALVEFPSAPPAAVMRGWARAVDPRDAFGLMFPIGDSGGHSHGSSPAAADPMRGTTILGEPGDAKPSKEPPLPCTIDDWSAGSIALRCTSDAAGYAVVSSSAMPGWSVTVDDAPAPWVTADVLRRAVAFPAGEHRVRWTYSAPGLSLGLAIAGVGLALLIALGLASRR